MIDLITKTGSLNYTTHHSEGNWKGVKGSTWAWWPLDGCDMMMVEVRLPGEVYFPTRGESHGHRIVRRAMDFQGVAPQMFPAVGDAQLAGL